MYIEENRSINGLTRNSRRKPLMEIAPNPLQARKVSKWHFSEEALLSAREAVSGPSSHLLFVTL
jgi:hypothetical protein